MAKKTTKNAPAAKTTKSAKAAPAKEAAKPAKKKSASGESKVKKMSAIDAAAKLLVASSEPMNCKALVETMAKKGLWTSPGGKTPHATLYSLILREIATKGKDARFKKTERGHFAAAK